MIKIFLNKKNAAQKNCALYLILEIFTSQTVLRKDPGKFLKPKVRQ